LINGRHLSERILSDINFLSPKKYRREVELAAKFAEKKQHTCLAPGCSKVAVRGHSVQRSLSRDALSDKGRVMTTEWSFNDTFNKQSPEHPPSIISVGVNDAGIFDGYCSEHDSFLFRSAEILDKGRNNAFSISAHIKAVTLECCRKRKVVDFFTKLGQITHSTDVRLMSHSTVGMYEKFFAFHRVRNLDQCFAMISGQLETRIDYFAFPFNRNLGVACCGVFGQEKVPFSTIGYNLICYPERSLLLLTALRSDKEFLDLYAEPFVLSKNIELLVNDIAFHRSEEPLIAPRLWKSLSSKERLDLRLALRPPNVRSAKLPPRIVRLSPSDLVSKIADLPAWMTQAFVDIEAK
jgi:hypothetical protein